MVAAVLLDGDRATVVDLDLPAAGPGQVRVAVEAAAVCGRDRAQARAARRAGGGGGGPGDGAALPVVLGHEAVGEVTEVGADVAALEVGDRVLVTSARSCGRCGTCVRGLPGLCRTAAADVDRVHGLVDGAPVRAALATGALADATVVDASAVRRLPDGIPAAHAVLFSCAAPTGLGAVRNVARAWPGEAVVVLGAGAVGLFAVQGTTLAGATPAVVVDPDDGRRALADDLGARTTVTPADALRAVAAATDGLGADHVVVATDGPGAAATAFGLVRPGGTVVVVADGDDAVAVPDPARRGLTLRGTVRGDGTLDDDLPQLLELGMDRRLVLDPLVGDDVSLAAAAAMLAPTRGAATPRDAGAGLPPPRQLVRP